jgi:hypothetical protein
MLTRCVLLGKVSDRKPFLPSMLSANAITLVKQSLQVCSCSFQEQRIELVLSALV